MDKIICNQFNRLVFTPNGIGIYEYPLYFDDLGWLHIVSHNLNSPRVDYQADRAAYSFGSAETHKVFQRAGYRVEDLRFTE